MQQQNAIAAALEYLKGRVERDEPLPQVALTPQPQRQREEGDGGRLRATVAFVAGLEEGGVKYPGLRGKGFEMLLGYMMHAWADNGPEIEQGPETVQEQVEGSNEEDSEEGDWWKSKAGRAYQKQGV